MRTKLIRLTDGTLVEVEISSDLSEPVSGGAARRVETKFDIIAPILVKVCEPVASAWEQLKQTTDVETAEIELGVSFEAEGNLYITRSKANANLTIKFTLKSKEL